METITVRPRDERELALFRSFFREKAADVDYAPRKAERLEEKMVRLYAEGHYTDGDMRAFFSIPKGHRTDPFDVIEGGDVYYADQRNVNYVNENLKRAKKDRESGRIFKVSTESFEKFLESI